MLSLSMGCPQDKLRRVSPAKQAEAWSGRPGRGGVNLDYTRGRQGR